MPSIDHNRNFEHTLACNQCKDLQSSQVCKNKLRLHHVRYKLHLLRKVKDCMVELFRLEALLNQFFSMIIIHIQGLLFNYSHNSKYSEEYAFMNW